MTLEQRAAHKRKRAAKKRSARRKTRTTKATDDWATARVAPGVRAAHINRKLEAMCKLHGAKKTLYSSVHFNETEFRAEYNGDFYQHIKQKYDANGRLRPLYDRLTRS